MNTFTFSHTYFSNRLFLTQLVDASTARPYQFFYDQPQNLPARISKAQDYWGFYNGKTSNNTLLPKINGASLNGVRYLNYQEGADREPDFDFMKKGILNKITYPSGGETRFVYESHQYGNLTGTINVFDTIRTVSNQNVAVIADPSGWKETTFVLDHAQEISITANVKGANTKTELRDLSGTLYFSHYSNGSNQMQTVQKDVYLEAGSYKLRAFNWESDFFASMVAGYAIQTDIDIYKFKNGGGIRVKEVEDFSDSQTLASKRIYEYTLQADPDRSSGILISNYIYDYLQTKSGYVAECGVGFVYDAVYHVRLTSPSVPLASSAGSHVEYSEVTERYEEGGGKGKTVTFYTSSKESGNRDINSYTFPYMASVSRGYKRGKVKRIESYRLLSGNYTLIREVQNEYQSLPALDDIYGISIGLVAEYPAMPHNNVYNHNSYSFARDYYAQTSSIERSYDGSMAEKKVEFYYDNTIHCKPTRIELTNSDGSNEVTYTAYPSDYANTTGFIGEMKSNYLIAYPIEQVRYREVGSTRTVLSGSITTYKTGGKGLMDQVLALETASPVPLASFKFSNRSMGQLPPSVGSPGNYSADTRYKPRLMYNSYDTRGNPLQVTQADGVSTSYVWGYSGQYPVAEVRNATYAEVTATGVNLSVLNSLTSTDAQRNAELAKIRNDVTMKKALVTTYAYRPLYGISSSTDASGRAVWYDYDSFGRLWRTRDHHGNVTEEYKYNYRQ